jgi:DNA-binding MarR family transcriptional regulator
LPPRSARPRRAQLKDGFLIATTVKASPAPDRLAERELGAWRGLLRVHASLSKALDASLEAEHGLPLTSYEVLMYLADAESMKMRMCDLAESVILSRSGLTRLVDRLERDGLLTRETCSSDARGAFAKLTPAGRERLAAARVTHLAQVRALFLDLLSPEELEVLGSVWERVLPGAAGAAAGGDGCC